MHQNAGRLFYSQKSERKGIFECVYGSTNSPIHWNKTSHPHHYAITYSFGTSSLRLKWKREKNCLNMYKENNAKTVPTWNLLSFGQWLISKLNFNADHVLFSFQRGFCRRLRGPEKPGNLKVGKDLFYRHLHLAGDGDDCSCSTIPGPTITNKERTRKFLINNGSTSAFYS